MSQHSDDSQDGPLTVPDEDLPDDVRPDEDNPLAQPAGDDVPEDILAETSEKRPLEESEGSAEPEGGEG